MDGYLLHFELSSDVLRRGTTAMSIGMALNDLYVLLMKLPFQELATLSINSRSHRARLPGTPYIDPQDI
jgi:hypothetical protein